MAQQDFVASEQYYEQLQSGQLSLDSQSQVSGRNIKMLLRFFETSPSLSPKERTISYSNFLL
jgi:hypothetical protein